MYSAPIDNELVSPSPRRPSNASAASSAAVSSNTGANPQTRHEHTRGRQAAGGVAVAVTSASSGPLADFHMAQHDDVSSVPDTPITPGTAGTVGTGQQQFSTAADGAATNSAAPSRMLSKNASFAHAGGSHTDDVDQSTTVDAAPDSHHPRPQHQPQQQLRPSGSVEMEQVPMASTNPNDVAMQRRNPATWAYIKGQLEDQQRQRLHRWREQRQVERERFTSLPRDGASPSVSPSRAVVSSRQTSPATRPMHRQQRTTGGSASSAGLPPNSDRDHAEHDHHQTHRSDQVLSGRTRERRSSPQARQVQPPRPTLRSDGGRVTSVSPTARRGQVPGHERLTNMYDPTDLVHEDARLADESAFTSFDVERAPPQPSQGHHPRSQHPQRAQHDARGREISERDAASVMTPPAYLDSSSVADTQLSSNVEAAHHVPTARNNAARSTAYDRSGLVDTPAAVRSVAGRDTDRVQVGEWQDTSVSAVAAPTTGDVERHSSSHVTSRVASRRDSQIAVENTHNADREGQHLGSGHSAEPSITQQSPIDRGVTTSPHQDNGSDPSAAASIVPRGRVARPSDDGIASHPYRGDELELERPTHPSVTATSDQQLELDRVRDAERVHSSRRGSGVDSHRSHDGDGVAALRGQSATAYGSSISVDAVEAALDAATINRDAALYLHHEQQRQHREVLSALHGIEDSVKKKVLEALHMDDHDGDHGTENITQETQSTHRSTLGGQHRRSRGDSGRTGQKHTPRRGGNDTSAKEKEERDARRRSARSRSPASRLQHQDGAPHRPRTPTSRSLNEADNSRAVVQHATVQQGHEEEEEEDLASLRARVLGTTAESELTDEERKARLVAQLLAVGGGRPPRRHTHHPESADDGASNDGGRDRDLRGLGGGSAPDEHKSGAQTRSTSAAESEPSHAQPMTLSEESDLRRTQQHAKHSSSADGGWPTRPWERNDAYPSSDQNGTSGGASRSMSEAAPGSLSHAEASSTRSYSGSSSIAGGRMEDIGHREREADGRRARQQHEPAHDDCDGSVVDENDSDADENLRQSAVIRKLKMELAAANAKITSLEGDVTSLRDQVKSKDDLLHKVLLQHRKTAAKAVADVTPSKTEKRPDSTSADPDASTDQDRRAPQAPAITNVPTAGRPTARVRPAMVTPSSTTQQAHQQHDESLVHTPAAITQLQTPAVLHHSSYADSKLHSEQQQREEQLPKAPQFRVQSSAWNDLRLGLSATLPMTPSSVGASALKSSNTEETTDLTALQSTANAAAASAAVASAENGAKRRATAKVQQRFPLRSASGAQDSLPHGVVPPHSNHHVNHQQSALALQQHQSGDATASTAHASAVASALSVSGIQALPDSTSVASEAARKEEEARLDEARQKALLAARDSITAGGGVSVSDLRRALQDHEQSRRAMLQTLKYGKEAEAQPRATNNIAA